MIFDLRAQCSESFICADCRRRRRRVPGFETGVYNYYNKEKMLVSFER